MNKIEQVPMSVVDDYLQAQERLEQKIRIAVNAQLAREAIESYRWKRRLVAVWQWGKRLNWDVVLAVAAWLTVAALVDRISRLEMS